MSVAKKEIIFSDLLRGIPGSRFDYFSVLNMKIAIL